MAEDRVEDERNEAAEDPDNMTPVQMRPENVIEGAEGGGRETKPGGMNPGDVEDAGEEAPSGTLPPV